MIFPDAPGPEFTGQAVWRYNLPRPDDVVSLHAYEGPIGAGLMPLSKELMYMFLTTPEPDNRRYPREQLAETMRSKIEGLAPALVTLGEKITDNDEVVYKPLEWLMLEGAWHKGRIVLLGDAVHATTPHLGQGAGMAIEDSIVLADELAKADTAEAAFRAFRDRRFARCDYIVRSSLAICHSQLGKGPRVEQAKASHDMFLMVAEPI
jgi:2-polyprenyl-6-methoxyphenol hydroxylase-like FAD-dependent oxidoreductase